MSRRWRIAAGIGAVLLVAAGVLWWNGPQQSLRRELASIGTPDGLTVVRTRLPRDRFLKLCIDSCPNAERFFVSTLSEEATATAVEDALRKRGYQVSRDAEPTLAPVFDETEAATEPDTRAYASGGGHRDARAAAYSVSRLRDGRVVAFLLVGLE